MRILKIVQQSGAGDDQVENPDIADDKPDDIDDWYGSNKLLFPPPKRRKTAYLQLSKVNKIFPDLPAKQLCQIAETLSYSPVEVQALVPEAISE